jgi:hypothetical protein
MADQRRDECFEAVRAMLDFRIKLRTNLSWSVEANRPVALGNRWKYWRLRSKALNASRAFVKTGGASQEDLAALQKHFPDEAFAGPAVPCAEASRRDKDEHKAKVYRLADENGHLLDELLQLVGSDAGFGNKTRIREIGEELNRIGGMDLLQCAYYGVRNAGRCFSQDIWHGVGSWRC